MDSIYREKALEYKNSFEEKFNKIFKKELILISFIKISQVLIFLGVLFRDNMNKHQIITLIGIWIILYCICNERRKLFNLLIDSYDSSLVNMIVYKQIPKINRNKKEIKIDFGEYKLNNDLLLKIEDEKEYYFLLDKEAFFILDVLTEDEVNNMIHYSKNGEEEV